MAGGIRAVARMSLRAPRQHGGNVVIAHARPSLRAVASFPQARGGVVAVAGSADAPGTAVRAAAAVGAIARRDAATSSGRIAHLAAGIAPRFRSLRCTAPARTALNASSGDDDERVNLPDLSDDPFEHVALPVDEAAFDAAVDDIIADDDADAPASTSSAWSYSAPGDDLPGTPTGAWPEFDALLGKLMAKGYRIEPEGAVASTVDASVSTPEWARAVAKSYDRDDGEIRRGGRRVVRSVCARRETKGRLGHGQRRRPCRALVRQQEAPAARVQPRQGGSTSQALRARAVRPRRSPAAQGPR